LKVKSAPTDNGDGQEDNRPIIPITTEEHEVNDQAVQALADDPTLYQRGGMLVHIIHTDKDEEDASHIHRPAGTPQIRALPPSLLRERLTKYARFQKFEGRGWNDTHPPGWCVAAVYERGQWERIRCLRGITTVAVLRPDGTLLTEPGYDPATRLLYEPTGPIPEIPNEPTRKQVWDAVRLLLDVVRDFPFEKPVHRSAWLAFHLTLLSRYAFDGPVPLTLFDANTPGTGKGLLVHTSSIITNGRMATTRAYSSDDAEMRKVITTIAIKGDTFVLLDNLTSALGGAALDIVLTSTQWGDRTLGYNRDVDLPINTVWAATGNNVMLKDDMPRRVMHCRLISSVENPEDRTDFKYPDLLAHVRENRGKLLAAGLTILRGYCAAGRPDMHLKPWGSYEAWSALVRNAVVWAGRTGPCTGFPDPGDSRLELRRVAQQEFDAVPALFAGLERLDPGGAGVSVRRMLAEGKNSGDETVRAMYEALCLLCPGRNGEPHASPVSVGMKLHHLKDRIIGGKALQRIESTNHAIGIRWKIASAGTTATTGTNFKPVKKSGG
jgi:hypothetical protein